MAEDQPLSLLPEWLALKLLISTPISKYHKIDQRSDIRLCIDDSFTNQLKQDRYIIQTK